MELMLQTLRQECGLTQGRMAELLGVSSRTYGSWERGEAQLSLEQACRCADALGCSLDALAGRAATLARPSDLWQAELLNSFEETDDEGRAAILSTARLARRPAVRVG